MFCFSPSLSEGLSEDGVGWCRSRCGTESTLSWPEIWPARTFSNPEKFLRETSWISGGDPGRVRSGDFFTLWESSGRRKNGIGSLSFSSSVNDPKNIYQKRNFEKFITIRWCVLLGIIENKSIFTFYKRKYGKIILIDNYFCATKRSYNGHCSDLEYFRGKELTTRIMKFQKDIFYHRKGG